MPVVLIDEAVQMSVSIRATGERDLNGGCARALGVLKQFRERLLRCAAIEPAQALEKLISDPRDTRWIAGGVRRK